MSLNDLLFIVTIVVGIFLIIGIIKKLLVFVLTAVAIVLGVWFIWFIMPPEYKAVTDVTLALSGNAIFSNINESTVQYLNGVDILINTNGTKTRVTPVLQDVKIDNSQLSNENNNEFNLNRFFTKQKLVQLKILTTPENADRLEKVLLQLGLTPTR